MPEHFNPVEHLGLSTGALVLTCEHASNALPPWLNKAEGDSEWLQSHWGWDIGAADLTRALAQLTGADAILSRFSRLVCDPNRSPRDPTWIRHAVEGHHLGFNHQMASDERQRREQVLHQPYHQAIDRLLTDHDHRHAGGFLLLSVHSFTANYMGEQRALEAGVLFDDRPTLAVAFMNALRLQGLDTRLNEPYSGLAGMIHAVSRHGGQHGVRYLELEVRNDLIDTPDKAGGMARRIARALSGIAFRA
jgi:predicted N-formylglutamate amidohydrolase